ncbi:hypothetical protein ROZALSC1DRAFT_25489 [Rozella allomycis CSF55]|uniref:Uncharacterized protein n=1 Tax=Rozella allomycis (strain CSF55) TaxID=988480 RepID=A0A4P9YB44_ROZAC|nr:hypothetical protein ROZALSC1DRAFT_25489 [Rozella allomycis CSF55]
MTPLFDNYSKMGGMRIPDSQGLLTADVSAMCSICQVKEETDSSEVYSKLLSKHPQKDNVYTEFKGISESIKTTRETVLKALLSFPKDTASGLSKLKARHLID